MAALDSRLHAVDSGFRELGIPGFVTKVELGFSNRKEDSGFYKQTFLDSFFFFFNLICLFISYKTTITQCILTITLIILK